MPWRLVPARARRGSPARCGWVRFRGYAAMTRRTPMPGLSIFFPAYNDSGTIASLVIRAVQAAAHAHARLRGASSSTTAARTTPPQILDELARIYPEHVRIVHHPKNRGYGGALRTGFEHRDQGPASSTPTATRSTTRPRWRCSGRRMTDDVDWVNGWKISRSDPLHRIVIGRIYHHTVKLLFGLKVRDVDCDFRLMRRRIFDVVRLEKNSGVICLEMMKKFQDAGFRVAEVPVHHYHRAYGKSQFFNFRRIFRTGVDVMKLWWALVIRREHLDAQRARAAAAGRQAS